MIVYEDSLQGKLQTLFKKFDMNLGIPKKIDGPNKLIDYGQKCL